MDNEEVPVVSAPALKKDTPPTESIEIPQYGMWIGFLYVLYFISLYVWSTSFGNIVHELVNRYVKDALELEEVNRSLGMLLGSNYVINWSLSAIVVFYPVFAISHLVIAHFILKKPQTLNIKVRKLLIYITLAGTFLIGCWRLVKFVYAFLDGTVTFKTFLHFAVTLSIAGIIFGFYFWQIKRDKD